MAGDEELPAAALAPPGRHHARHVLAGDDLGRILALSDGVFAFAMTLLALSLTVPVLTGTTGAAASGPLGAALWRDWTAFLGYAFAFIMIGVWWAAHNRTFQYVARYNSTLIWINMALLLEIAVMPFVLSVFIHYSDTMVAIDLFAGIQVALGITNTGLWDYARHSKLLQPGVPEAAATFYSRRGYLTAAVFAGSIGVSFVSVTAAELSWILVFVLTRYFGRYVD